jgi:hypothetical protein
MTYGGIEDSIRDDLVDQARDNLALLSPYPAIRHENTWRRDNTLCRFLFYANHRE